MINYVKGDLIKMAFANEFDIIAHGANCFCTMGGGIARQIHNEIPEAYDADCQTVKGDITKLGNYTSSFIHNSDCIIFNCYTQYEYGTDKMNVDYNAIALCMKKLNHEYPGKKIGLPLIGAGLAGGDWDIIEAIIELELKDMDVTVVLFEPPTPLPTPTDTQSNSKPLF